MFGPLSLPIAWNLQNNRALTGSILIDQALFAQFSEEIPALMPSLANLKRVKQIVLFVGEGKVAFAF